LRIALRNILNPPQVRDTSPAVCCTTLCTPSPWGFSPPGRADFFAPLGGLLSVRIGAQFVRLRIGCRRRVLGQSRLCGRRCVRGPRVCLDG
jgi:hypothetical protein